MIKYEPEKAEEAYYAMPSPDGPRMPQVFETGVATLRGPYDGMRGTPDFITAAIPGGFTFGYLVGLLAVGAIVYKVMKD